MFRLITKKIPRQSCLATSVAVSPLRYYHSYPDPKEKPTIIQTKSDVKKSLDKSGSEFQLPSKFRMDELFPGTVVSSGIKNTNLPETRATVLPNGLTVATQEMPGLMSSFCLIVKTGR